MVISNGLKHKDKIKSLTHNSKIHKHACPTTKNSYRQSKNRFCVPRL